jgi:hypothetical protein
MFRKQFVCVLIAVDAVLVLFSVGLALFEKYFDKQAKYVGENAPLLPQFQRPQQQQQMEDTIGDTEDSDEEGGVNCGCRKGCSTNRCVCKKAGKVCSESCSCRDCQNHI